MRTKAEYIEYLKSFIIDQFFTVSYDKLFSKLYDTEFVAIMPLDDNRICDAENLRNGFDISDPISVFEVLIALSIRCEEQIMHENNRGDRRGLLFWEMIGNMGLGSQTDENYNEEYCDDILRKFLYHNYGPNGLGCAFRSTAHKDLTNYELWYQMNLYINDILEVH